MGDKAKKSKKDKQNKVVPSKKSKPTKPTPKQPTVKAERPTTSALTLAPAIPHRSYVTSEATIAIVRRRTKDDHYLSIRYCGKELVTVPVPFEGEMREEVDTILRLLVRRMAELINSYDAGASIGVIRTGLQPVLALFPLVGQAYL